MSPASTSPELDSALNNLDSVRGTVSHLATKVIEPLLARYPTIADLLADDSLSATHRAEICASLCFVLYTTCFIVSGRTEKAMPHDGETKQHIKALLGRVKESRGKLKR